MTIEPGSLRYTDSKGTKSIAQPDSNLYRVICDVAQERFDKVTRTWLKIPNKYPTALKSGDDYRVYLDGVIVPWWRAADRDRGWVEVWAEDSRTLHRLFGKVAFEPAVLSEL